MDKVKTYYWLAKPGIVYGNVIAAMAGFFLASSRQGQLDFVTFAGLIVGLAFVIGSACVLNNYIDRDIDRKMKRTKNRAIVIGEVSEKAAIIYTSVLGGIGFGLLIVTTNWLTVSLGVLAYVAYIVLYGIAKRKTVHGTLVGTISGAIPPAAGYVAVTNRFDEGAALLFLIMVCWQMPHFYAIAMRRQREYADAKIPVLPVVYGTYVTKIQILLYMAAFILANSLLVIYGFVGYTYLGVVTLVGILWLLKGVRGFRIDNDEQWARKMFLFSIIVLLVMCVMIAVGGYLP